ncbi:WbqC family protein [Streptomyces chrestomyceticus]|uniref:WbqC family protein n=1 Tax=Streptomyces chrestomyceticus TaxID=68185 RepID=UPI0019D2216F|nr:WbqC family protein [Streptomyces chrestomyceticus]
MPPTSPSSRTVSTAASSPPDLPPPGGRCAIHQPNFFPRLTTLAKLFAADYWIVLDDVQFARRDYQHRARLAALNDPTWRQWLTLPTHLPNGRSTLIRDAEIVDPTQARRRIRHTLRHCYGASPHWPALRPALTPVLDLITTSGRTAAVAEASTQALLEALGWPGRILRSSALPSRPGRTQRLVDLAVATGATTYLCGTGGMQYLRTSLFDAWGVTVTPFRPPQTGVWAEGREVSALTRLAHLGPLSLSAEFRALTADPPGLAEGATAGP